MTLGAQSLEMLLENIKRLTDSLETATGRGVMIEAGAVAKKTIE